LSLRKIHREFNLFALAHLNVILDRSPILL
jgi:hypothetical protein